MTIEASIEALSSLLPDEAPPWDAQRAEDLARLEAAAGRRVPALLERLFRLQGGYDLTDAVARSPIFSGTFAPVLESVSAALRSQESLIDDFGTRLRSKIGWPVMAFGSQTGDPGYWFVVGEDDDPPVMFLVDIGRPYTLVSMRLSKFVEGLVLPAQLQPRLCTVGSETEVRELQFLNDQEHRAEVTVEDTSCYDSDELVAAVDEVMDSMMTQRLPARSSVAAPAPLSARELLMGVTVPPRYRAEAHNPVFGVHAGVFQDRMRPVVGLCVLVGLALVDRAPIEDRIGVFGLGRGAIVSGDDAAAVLRSWRVEGSIDELGSSIRDRVGPIVLRDIRPVPD